jgi:hypothetical protein
VSDCSIKIKEGLMSQEVARKRMDIYSACGTKVVFAFPNDGAEYDQETAKKYLKEGGIYTIKETEVGGSRTFVYLEEFPGIVFSSALFGKI